MTWFDFFALGELMGSIGSNSLGGWLLGVITFIGAIWIEKFFYYVGKIFIQYEIYLLLAIVILTLLIPYFKSKEMGVMRIRTFVSIVATFLIGYILYAIFIRHLSLKGIKILPLNWWIGDAIEWITEGVYKITKSLPFLIGLPIYLITGITAIIFSFLLTIIDYIAIPLLIFPCIQNFIWKNVVAFKKWS